MKKLGVIGGLGPLATSHFFELVVRMTDASCDQEHMDMVIYNYPSIPDRTNYILQKSNENPFPKMLEVAKRLHKEEVDYIVVPCITAHYFYQDLQQRVETPIINMVQETVDYLYQRKIKKVGIMATEGTIQSRIVQEIVEKAGMELVVPSEEKEKELMDLIYKEVKANKPIDMYKFESITKYLQEKGAEVIILGCTELSVVKREITVGPGFIDALEVLALRSIKLCGYPVRREYEELITV